MDGIRTHLAIASALIETPETFPLDGGHTVPIVNKVTQIDPRLSRSNVARQQVPTSRLESNSARGVVRRCQDAAVRQSLTAGFGHLELLLDSHLVGTRPL